MRALAAFVLTFAVGMALYPAFIAALARRHAGQRVSDYVPGTHRVKAGTPTMGGALFVVLAVAAWLLLDRSRTGFLTAFGLLGGGLLGVLDDVANIRGRGALGLIAGQKLLLQGAVGVLLGVGLEDGGLTAQLLPGGAPDIGWFIVPVTVIAVIAATNAVNLTDGVDGLAASCSALALATLWVLAAHIGDRSAAIGAAAVLGGVLAFIVYNWFPARVFMGDTGSLAIGAGLTALSAELRILWLLPLLGLVFAAETLSVIINITAVKHFGRRVFRASPLHHHFEEIGLREQALVGVFVGAGAVCAVLTVFAALSMGIGA